MDKLLRGKGIIFHTPQISLVLLVLVLILLELHIQIANDNQIRWWDRPDNSVKRPSMSLWSWLMISRSTCYGLKKRARRK